MAARGTVVLLVVLMASSAISGEPWRVKRDKGGHHHQDVGRRRQAVATTSEHWYGSPVVAVHRPHDAPTAIKRQQIQRPYHQHFRHPTRRPNRMVPQQQWRQLNVNQQSHAPIGPQQHYAPQQPQRPSYIPVPLPIHLQPASIVLPSPPPQSYQPQQPPQQSSYGGAYQPSQPVQQYVQAPAPAPYQSPPPPPPPPQQPHYQPQPQYQQAPPPPPPAPYQPPQPQYQPLPPPPPASYQQPQQIQQFQPPPPPPPQQAEFQPQYVPLSPPPPPPHYEHPAPAAPQEYVQPAPAPQEYAAPAPQEYAPPAPQEYAPPASAPAHSDYSSAIVPLPPLLPPPLYARQPQPQSQQQQQDNFLVPAPEFVTASVQYTPESTAAPSWPAEQHSAPASGGYAASEPVTVPTIHDDGFSTLAPAASDHDLHTNAISSSDVALADAPKKESTSQWTEGSIPWTLEKLGLNTLNDLLVLSGLDEMFDKEGPFTVFVPVDQAFEILIQRFGGMEKASEEFNKNPDVLESLLKHHVVPGAVQSSALQNNGVMQSLLKTPLRVKFYESEDNEWRPLKVITVNGARVVRPDIQATNGVIHIVDRVLFPVPQADIYNTLKNDPQQRYTTLISAIDRAGLQALLGNPTAGPYTVFAPTNKAFSLISRAELNGILNDPAKLTKLVQRHVVQDLIYTSGLQGFQKAYALDFEILYIYHAKGMTKVNGANVVDQDMTTLNGVIHTIDSVLGLY